MTFHIVSTLSKYEFYVLFLILIEIIVKIFLTAVKLSRHLRLGWYSVKKGKNFGKNFIV